MKDRRPVLGSHHLRQLLGSEDLQQSFQVVCQHVQAHFGTNARQSSGQKVRRSHAGLKGSEGMLGGLLAHLRNPEILVQPPLCSGTGAGAPSGRSGAQGRYRIEFDELENRIRDTPPC